MNNITHNTRRAVMRVTQHEKVRFGLVGIVNTLVDFGILNILVLFVGVAVLPANIASTTVGMITSFALNKNAVFGASGGTRRQFILFFAVTIVGIWLVQSLILINLYEFLKLHSALNDTLLLNIAKLIGIGFGLIWNYLWYSRVVFVKKQEQS